MRPSSLQKEEKKTFEGSLLNNPHVSLLTYSCGFLLLLFGLLTRQTTAAHRETAPLITENISRRLALLSLAALQFALEEEDGEEAEKKREEEEEDCSGGVRWLFPKLASTKKTFFFVRAIVVRGGRVEWP